jgi:hypothetical protein
MKFSLAEIATILAALQFYREAGYGNHDMYRWLSQRILRIASRSHTLEPLDEEKIDTLMARLAEEEENPSA